MIIMDRRPYTYVPVAVDVPARVTVGAAVCRFLSSGLFRVLFGWGVIIALWFTGYLLVACLVAILWGLVTGRCTIGFGRWGIPQVRTKKRAAKRTNPVNPY